jgi:hypothetical protein
MLESTELDAWRGHHGPDVVGWPCKKFSTAETNNLAWNRGSSVLYGKNRTAPEIMNDLAYVSVIVRITMICFVVCFKPKLGVSKRKSFISVEKVSARWASRAHGCILMESRLKNIGCHVRALISTHHAPFVSVCLSVHVLKWIIRFCWFDHVWLVCFAFLLSLFLIYSVPSRFSAIGADSLEQTRRPLGAHQSGFDSNEG